ncbi:MAG TPA: AbiV family abortive infection protein [Candidatus Binatia bacterium]|jgi:AbiV family abortive infection protein
MPLHVKQKALLRLFTEGARKTFENAQELFAEAVLLAKAQAFGRAFFLHQISLEECAKVEMLGTSVTSLLMGHEVGLNNLRKAFRSHEIKNRANAYFLTPTKAELAARERNDVSGAVAAFSKLQGAFHAKSNAGKNASLYVDFGDSFTSPREVITARMVAKIRRLNSRYVRLMEPKVGMLLRWEQNPEAIAEKLAQMEKQLLLLKERFPKEPATALEIFMEELSRARSDSGGQQGVRGSRKGN